MLFLSGLMVLFLDFSYTIYVVEWVLSDLFAMVKHLMETING